jgi:tetratricopeptide (TPR) repeat protein
LLGKIPGTIKGLILARFDRLPESVRQTLQKAAVIGASFPASLLHMLNGMSAKTMGAHLDELEARQFLCPQPFRSEPGYTFLHALFQETAYSTLLKRDRGQLHTQVAQAIEQSQAWLPDEKTEALAHHYVRSTEPTLAIPHLITGAANAARRCAYETAVEHYRWAIKLLPAQPNGHNQEYFQVRIGLGRSLKFIGELTEAGQILSEVLQYLRDSGLTEESAMSPVLVESLRQLADVRQREGVYDEALALLETGLQLLGETGAQEHPSLWYSLLDRMAWIRFRQGQLEEASALAHAATAESNPEVVNDPIKLASLYNTLGGISWQQGHLDKAVSYVEQSLRLHERAGYFWGKAIAYGNLGVLNDALGNWPKALEYFDQAHTLQETIGDRQHRVVNLNNLGLVHLRMGKHRAARQALETGLSLALSLGDTWGEALCHTGLAEISLIQSNLEQAKRHVDEALAIAEEIGSSEIQVQALHFLALTLANNGGELQASLKVAAKALTMSQEAKLSAQEANCYRALGMLHTHAGQYTEAETYLQDSVTLSLGQNDPYRQGQALLELGRLYFTLAQADQSPDGDWKTRAVAMLNEAAEKFESLGAAYDLHLTQTVLSQIEADGQVKAEE